YMVPVAYVRLESMPLSPNGKLDRKALPSPDGEAYAQRAYEPAKGDVEETLAAIWAELLKIERVGRNDNFFELGGHSLLAAQLVSRARRALGIELPLSEIFAHPVLERLAARAERAANAKHEAIVRVERGGLFPLAPSQQRLWFLSQLEGANS